MIDSITQGIFPTPVYIASLNRKFLSKENKFLQKTKRGIYKNVGNLTSHATYILDNKNLSQLKKNLEEMTQDYFDKVLSAKNVKPYITQSWLNYTTKDQYHHKHAHDNSLVSGVFYINVDKKHDKITFFKERYELISPAVNKYNIFNSGSWWFPVETGQLFLFPSSLTHMVEAKKENNTRMSLAFNVFVRGVLGKTKDLTELKL
jgi:uncharacterized protein (TIGR02466 family)